MKSRIDTIAALQFGGLYEDLDHKERAHVLGLLESIGDFDSWQRARYYQSQQYMWELKQ